MRARHMWYVAFALWTIALTHMYVDAAPNKVFAFFTAALIATFSAFGMAAHEAECVRWP